MDNIIIKECNLQDIEQIKYIGKKTFCETFSGENTKEDMEKYLKENFSSEQLEKEIRNENSKFFIVESNGETLAYMKLNFDEAQTEQGHNNTLEVQRIYVLEKCQGKGIGNLLMERSIEISRENDLNYIWLGVWENNIDAIRFYEKLGFEKFDKHIFKLGEDEQVDYLMKLII